MIRLNLSNLEESQIKYTISKFPDGQQDIILDTGGSKLSGFTGTGSSWSVGVQIGSRFSSFRDLELIICATKALRRMGVKEIHLYIPYILGARSDRKFQEGGTSYLVDVIAPIINALGFESVTALDAHSDISEAVINNFAGSDNVGLVRWGLKQLDLLGDDSVVLVSPDAGSLKKVYNVAKGINFRGDIVIASKHRDVITGKLSDTYVNLNAIDLDEDKNYVIIDDICDGGRTFINLAEAIRKRYQKSTANVTITLIVSHGIFSAGLDGLYREINNIVTTNSIQEAPLSLEENAGTFYQMQVI